MELQKCFKCGILCGYELKECNCSEYSGLCECCWSKIPEDHKEELYGCDLYWDEYRD